MFRRANVELLVLGGFMWGRRGLFQCSLSILHHRPAHLQRLELTPISHGRGRVEASGLLEGAIGLEVPEVVKQSETLTKVSLRGIGAGGYLQTRVANALHQRGRREIPVLRSHHVIVVDHHSVLSGNVAADQSGDAKTKNGEAKRKNVSMSRHWVVGSYHKVSAEHLDA